MRFTSLTTSLLTFCTVSAQARRASPRLPTYNNGEQIPIGDTLVLEPEPTETITIHYSVTKTLYEFEFGTATAARPAKEAFTPAPYYTILPDYGVVMKRPPPEQPRRKPETSDETAFALCRWQLGCQEENELW